MPTLLPLWKKAVYGVVVAGVFFAGLELLLRAVGQEATVVHSDPYVGFECGVPLFVEHQREDGAVVMRTARNKLRYFNAQQFAKQKPEDTFRIFCLGGSTTYGQPYDDLTSFSGWLREMLPQADRGRQWEVINAGGVSYASYRVAAVMEKLCDYEPDLFILYTGHNEFLEERTYRELKQAASSWLGKSTRSWITPWVQRIITAMSNCEGMC